MAIPKPGRLLSELYSLTVADLDVTAHPEGVAIRFGPGVPVHVADSLFDARRIKLVAAYALHLLSETLARKDA